MTTNFDWVALQSNADYKFFAYAVAQKLRNTNFKPIRRQTFLKSLMQELKPVCSFKTYERIEKIISEISNQKHQDEQAEKQRLKKQSNVKQKKLITIKAERKVNKYGVEQDYLSESDEQDYGDAADA